MLRRVAFLGGEIPQIKSLEEIPMPVEHADRSPYRSTALRVTQLAKMPDGACAVFCETRPMKAKFRRFCQELKIAKSIDSPHVVRVFQAPVDDHRFPYMAMERLRG